MTKLAFDVIKIFTLTTVSSALGVLLTPILTHFLYKYKLWRKNFRQKSIDGKEIPVFLKFHKEKEVSTPRFGGLIIWLTTIFVTLIFYFISLLFPQNFWAQKLNFFSRNQTWLPLFGLVSAGLIGILDDFLQVKGKGKYVALGLTFWQRFAIVFLIGLIGGLWFHFKLGWETIHVPGNGDIKIGSLYIPFFILVILACWSGGVIDGLDGLAGGVFAIIFSAYGAIAFFRNQIDLASFCGVIVGSTLAFLWFNIPPARFYMGETGSLPLTVTLGIVAFFTDSVLVLPIIGGLLVIESGSVILQLLSKKVRKKKLFLAAPIHHHLEAKGWGQDKIVMRFWILGAVLAAIGVAIRLLG
jgi:phospho-N-acetylmuramoyl-pentapeptide-transferase